MLGHLDLSRVRDGFGVANADFGSVTKWEPSTRTHVAHGRVAHGPVPSPHGTRATRHEGPWAKGPEPWPEAVQKPLQGLFGDVNCCLVAYLGSLAA